MCCPVSLRHHPGRTCAKTNNQPDADEPFFTYKTDFHTLPIGLNREDRLQSFVYEVARPDSITRLVHNLVELQTHNLQFRENHLGFISWEAN
jgi:hypothetical protein